MENMITVNFLHHFLTKSLPTVTSRLVWCAAATANLQARKRLCYILNRGVWKEYVVPAACYENQLQRATYKR
jgi:hypothetical protein